MLVDDVKAELKNMKGRKESDSAGVVVATIEHADDETLARIAALFTDAPGHWRGTKLKVLINEGGPTRA